MDTPTQTFNICILGFGNVGKALLRLLQEKKAELEDRYGIGWRLTGVASRRMGWIADPDGLDATALLENRHVASKVEASDVRSWLEAAQPSVLFEVTSLNVESGQPAIEHIRAALEYGAHVVTANKGPVVYAYQELRTLSLEHDKAFLFEATVMGGAPIFSLFRRTLPALNILRFRGLLNSTSNVIIGEMEQGQSFEDGVRAAQEMGIAETDPGADIDGWDSAVKLCAISTVLMNTPLKLGEIQREGIRNLTPDWVQAARSAGTPYKLVSTIERVSGGRVVASVKPERLSAIDPLAAVNGGSMLAHFETDVLAGLTVALDVPDSDGPKATAYDLLADFIRAVQGPTAGI